MKTEKKTCMEEQNKEVIQVSEEGIMFIDFLPTDYEDLVNLIAENNCMLIFDTEESYYNLQKGIAEFIRENCSIELGNKVVKFIAEEYSQQVEIINYISHD